MPSNSLSGVSPSISIQSVYSGGVFFKPMLDNMLRTYHTVPQVTVVVNNVPSKCSGVCDFQWLVSATPTVTNIDVSNQNSIVITGTGFDTVAQNNYVLLGDVACTVLTATATQLTVKPGTCIR